MDKNVLSSLTWDIVKEIVTVADSLLGDSLNYYPSEEDYYRDVLTKLWRENDCVMPVAERYKTVLRVAESVTGQKLVRSRTYASTFIRKMVTHRLINEGYGCSDIGRVMGRDHATVLYLAKCMDDMLSLPGVYKKEVEFYDEFVKRIEQSNNE